MKSTVGTLKIFIILGMCAFNCVAMAGIPDNGSKVLARYNNFYKGDDDYFAQCLVDNSGNVTIIGQGLQTIGIHHLTATSKDLAMLKKAIKSLPKNTKNYGYTGYNFMDLGADMNAGVVVSSVLSDGNFGYVALDDKMDAAILVKKICGMESND